MDSQYIVEWGKIYPVSYTHLHSVSLLLAHAEDQLANAELFEIVCRQMIRLYQKIDTLEQ